MATHTTSFLLLTALVCLFASDASARILTQCEGAKELVRGGVNRTSISNYVCIMQNESGMNTALITGPKTASSYSFGIFQINSAKWCKRGGRGGICNKRCENFSNDDIQDDIACAKIIVQREGFKHWKGWLNKCKGRNLPNVNRCIDKE